MLSEPRHCERLPVRRTQTGSEAISVFEIAKLVPLSLRAPKGRGNLIDIAEPVPSEARNLILRTSSQ